MYRVNIGSRRTRQEWFKKYKIRDFYMNDTSEQLRAIEAIECKSFCTIYSLLKRTCTRKHAKSRRRSDHILNKSFNKNRNKNLSFFFFNLKKNFSTFENNANQILRLVRHDAFYFSLFDRNFSRKWEAVCSRLHPAFCELLLMTRKSFTS